MDWKRALKPCVRFSTLAPSSSGRAPRKLRFCADAGHLLVAEVGATSVEVAVTDLKGALLNRQRGDGDVTRGPD